jgi:hypothetical protein
VRIGAGLDELVKVTSFRPPRHDGRAVLAAAKNGVERPEIKVGLLLDAAVAFEAMTFEQRFDARSPEIRGRQRRGI